MQENCSERKTVEPKNEITPQSARKPYPGFDQAVGILFLIFIAAIVIALMISIPANALGIARTDQISFVCFTATLVVLVFAYRQTRVSFGEVFIVKTFNPMFVIPLFITIIGLSVIVSEIDNISRILVPMPTKLFDFMMKSATAHITSWTKILFTILLIPIVEEALFRGVILRGFLKRYSTKKAIILSAILFAVAHLNPWNLVPAFMGGIFLAWLIVTARSLFTCILGHMAFNAIPLIIVSLPGLEIKGYSGMPTEAVQFQPLWFDMMGVLMICVGIVGIIFLKRKLKTSDL